MDSKETVTPLTRSEAGSRRKNSLAIAVILVFLVTLFYAVTIVRLKGNVANRAKMQSSGGVVDSKPEMPKAPKAITGGKQVN
jgi:hypothetical protein